MKKTFISLLSLINKEGLDNGLWGFVKDLDNVEEYFGAKACWGEKIGTLQGSWLYVFVDYSLGLKFIDISAPSAVCKLKDADKETFVLLYYADETKED